MRRLFGADSLRSNNANSTRHAAALRRRGSTEEIGPGHVMTGPVSTASKAEPGTRFS
jgi:hypothetical protein